MSVRSSGGGDGDSRVLLWLGLRVDMLDMFISSDGVGKFVLAFAPRNSLAAVS